MRIQRLGTLFLGLAALLLPGCGEETFQAPPDCEGRFLVAYARRPLTPPGQADVYLYDFDGLGFHLLPNLNDATLSDQNPTLTSDGRFIAFERELNTGDTDILLYDRCAEGIEPQPGLNTVGFEGQPAFSYDGRRLAFARDTLGRRRLRLYDGTTDRLIPLPALNPLAAYADSSPSINQTGNVIAFVSTRNGNPDIFVYDSAGDSLRDLPDLRSAGNDVDPSLTPDGKYLVFASDRVGGAGGHDIYLYNLQTTVFEAVAPELNTQHTEREPSINAAAERIVLVSNRPGGLGGLDLWLYTRSSGQVRRAGASSPTNDIHPYFSWP